MNVLHFSQRGFLRLRMNSIKTVAINAKSYSIESFEHPIVKRQLVFVQSKVSDALKWYEQLTGLDEVRIAQNRVIETQERFAAAQEKRREVTLELNDVKNKIKDLQEELSTTSRGEERFLALMTKEHKLLKEDIRLTEKFNLYEREERELFTSLTSSVKESHERERIQANTTKYLSIVGSIFGALIGIVGSAINNRSKITELKKMISESTEVSKRELSATCAQLELIANHVKSPAVNTDSVTKQLQHISERLKTLTGSANPEPNLIHRSLARIEKNLYVLMKNVSITPVDVKECEMVMNNVEYEKSWLHVPFFSATGLFYCFSVCLFCKMFLF